MWHTTKDGRVVPVVKLAKAMAYCFNTRPKRKISGYDTVSLAIDAFKDYQGPLEVKTMLVHLLGHSMDAVKSPITDSTGQSRHVDEYLGPAGSKLRRGASAQFGQMRAEVKRCMTKAGFNDLCCIGRRS